jgi:hydrogenase maturation protease
MPGRHARPGPARGEEAALVVGLGNPFRGDDALGPLVARLLRPRLEGIATVVELSGEGTGLLDLWEGRPLTVVVDAMKGGAQPGTVHRIEVGAELLPTTLEATSSHALSLGQAVALGQTLHRLPGRLIVYGVEAATFATGAEVSPPVVGAIPVVVHQIEEELRAIASEERAHRSGGIGHA